MSLSLCLNLSYKREANAVLLRRSAWVLQTSNDHKVRRLSRLKWFLPIGFSSSTQPLPAAAWVEGWKARKSLESANFLLLKAHGSSFHVEGTLISCHTFLRSTPFDWRRRIFEDFWWPLCTGQTSAGFFSNTMPPFPVTLLTPVSFSTFSNTRTTKILSSWPCVSWGCPSSGYFFLLSASRSLVCGIFRVFYRWEYRDQIAFTSISCRCHQQWLMS